MGERGECPRCGSYVSQIAYEGRHEHCGYRCRVEYPVSAGGWIPGTNSMRRRRVTIETTFYGIENKPTDAHYGALTAALAAAGATEDPEVDVSVLVDGFAPDREWLSAWLDPEKPTPWREPLLGPHTD